MKIQPSEKSAASSILIDWGSISEAGAFCELCKPLGVTLNIAADGKLKASGNMKAAQFYVADIAARYRGAIIAHLLQLPAPDVDEAQDNKNIHAMFIALKATIDDYCAESHFDEAYRLRLHSAIKATPPALFMQTLCVFRMWLFELRNPS